MNVPNALRACLLAVALHLGASPAKAVVIFDPGAAPAGLESGLGVAGGGVNFSAAGDKVLVAFLIVPAVDGAYVVREDDGIIVQILPPAGGGGGIGWAGEFDVPSELEVNTPYFLAGGARQLVGATLSSPVGTTGSFLLRIPIDPTPTGVPDGGGTALLLGFSMAAVGTIRHRNRVG